MRWRRPAAGTGADGDGRTRTGGGRPNRRSWPQRLALAAGCLSVMGLTASASGLAYVYRKYERLPRVELTGVLAEDDQASADRPENYLIVGVDNASGLDRDDPVRRGRDRVSRSDTIMVLRIDPTSRQAALLSLPRDLWVPVADSNQNQRINALVQLGGPSLLIRTIDEYLGVPVHHYVEVDFAAFQGLVEAVDGVPVHAPLTARDRETGLFLHRGCTTLDPDQALAYVRSRHYEELLDGEWDEDPSGDLGRIERQQDFIRRALSRAIDQGARNPRRLDQLIDVALDGVTVDDGFTADDIFRLGDRFRSFEPDDLVSYSVPTVGDTVGEAQILRLVEDEAEPVLAVFRGASESEISPAAVRLQVLNGSGQPGEASAAAAELTEAGFGVSGIGETASFDHARTVVRHPPGQRDAAELVARWLAGGAELEEDPGGAGVVVVTGDDWEGVRSGPRPSDESSAAGPNLSATTSTLPPASDLTTSSAPGSGASGSGVAGSGVAGTIGPTGPQGDGDTTGSGSATTTDPPAARDC